MTFIHGYMLGGLLLAGLPVLLHLLMRQKPRRVKFPAFQFLKAKQRTNQRKIQLQHWLLLLLRIAIIAALCLALARPRLFADRNETSSDRSVVAVVVVDTSASMDYAVSGVTRLEDAQRLAKELLDEMSDASRVALIDSGEDGASPLLPRGEARARLDTLRLRPGAGALNQAVGRGLRILETAEAEGDTPRLLYVFTDRTRAAWRQGVAAPRIPEGVRVIFVDVGAEAPRDLEVERVEVFPQVVPPGGRYEVRVNVRGTPTGHENELYCVLDTAAAGDRVPERRPIVLPKGITSSLVVFEMTAPTVSASQGTDVPQQVTVGIATKDALAVNNTRQATFFVRGTRRLLTLIEAPGTQTRVWEAVQAAARSFTCEFRTFAEADKLTPQQLAGYSVICLFQVKTVANGWWTKLAAHARAGGGVVIVPGGEEVEPGLDAFNQAGLAAGLLPAPLERLEDAPKSGLLWQRFRGNHPLVKPFVDWSRTVDPDFDRDGERPLVRRYWRVGALAKGGQAICTYDNVRRDAAALLERDVGKGRCILFTSPLDRRWLVADTKSEWNNYWTDSSFGLVLVDRVCRYLGGEVRITQNNFTCGNVPVIELPSVPGGNLVLSGPGLSGAERTVRPPQPEQALQVPQAVTPGNYLVHDDCERLLTGFSVNLPAGETQLDPIPEAELEAIFGKNTVVHPAKGYSLRDALVGSKVGAMELLPLLMMALLVVLTVESFLANRFYRAHGAGEGTPGGSRPVLLTPAQEGVA